MDSLTQLVLGAAVGEVVAGKKLGNKAMLWGALAGTIPDLDVVSGFWLDDLATMAVHRGITHSIAFSFLAPLAFAALARRYYQSGFHGRKWHDRFWQVFWILLGAGLITGSLFVLFGSFHPGLILPIVLSCGLGAWWIKKAVRQNGDSFRPISSSRWYALFFLCFITHITIDVFTTYGTQILQPFDSLRFSTNSIAVADPFYTLPFLTCLLIATFYKRHDSRRSFWNYTGLIYGIVYFAFTFYNKSVVNRAMRAGLDEQEIVSERFLTNPTIFNNFLWHGIAESDSAFYVGYYSIFDESNKFEKFKKIPKNHHLIDQTDCPGMPAIETLQWFSDDYFSLSSNEDGIYYHDLRFGGLDLEDSGEETPASPFFYRLDPGCEPVEKRLDPSDNGMTMSDALQQLIRRARGN